MMAWAAWNPASSFASRTRVEERGEGFALVPYLDETEAASGLLGLIRDAGYTSAATVSFDVDGGEVWVSAREGSRYVATMTTLPDASPRKPSES